MFSICFVDSLTWTEMYMVMQLMSVWPLVSYMACWTKTAIQQFQFLVPIPGILFIWISEHRHISYPFVHSWIMHVSYQFRFRNEHSPELVLLCLVDRITNALDNGESCVLRLFPISNTESLPQADYYSWDVCHSPLSGYFQHGRQQKYLISFGLSIFQICPIKSKSRFLKVCKILKRTWHFQTGWILCVLSCSGCRHVVNDAGSTCSCC